MKKVGDDFQQFTKYIRGKMSSGYLDWSGKPRVYKHYLDSRRVELPFPVEAVTLSFDEAVRNRRSVRRFSGKSLSLEQLGFLLWVSTGVQRVENGYAFRNAPSAGALYPVETYLFAKKVDGLKVGLYHYDVESHFLEELKLGDLSFSLSRAGLGQDMFANASVVFIWSGFFARSKWKYCQMAYIIMEMLIII